MEHPLLTGILAVGLLTGNIALVAGSAMASESDETMEFGMGPNSIEPQKAEGVAPDYQTIWIGPWTLESGWGGVNDQLEYMQSEGVTPVIHFYYWGDDISPTCYEEGCWSDIHNTWKDQQEWNQLAQELVDNLWTAMDGDRVVILMETEFNKNGMEDYEPFDDALAAKSDFFHNNYPSSETVLPFGNWKSWAWGYYDKSAAASDYVGIQGLRGSTQDSWESYHNLFEATLDGTQQLQSLFGKPIFVHDMGLSSYPEPDYLEPQANELSEFFERIDELEAAGVDAIIYRSWYNNPNMDTNNYYGEAERHWGLAYADTQEHKPAAQVWIDGVLAERSNDGNSAPTADVQITTDGLTIYGDASNSTDPDGDELTYTWRTGDGGYYTTETIEHTYAEPGTYDLYMSANDTQENDVTHVEVTVEEVGNRAPTADVDLTADGLTINATAANSTDPDGDELTYTWRTGDGGYYTTETIEHTYAEPGTYDLYMSANDTQENDVAHVELTVDEANGAPTAEIDLSTAGLTLNATAANSTDPDGDELTYTWRTGDGGYYTSETIEHTYAEPGTYDLYMAANDSKQSDVAHVEVTVDDGSPTAKVDITADGRTIIGDASNSTDPDGDELNYTWRTGDGGYYTTETIEHTYAEPGTYDVYMAANDSEQSDVVHEEVTVENGAPSAEIDLSTDGLTINATAANSTDPEGDELSYTWRTSDGGYYTTETIEHTFAEAGTYDVYMAANDSQESDVAHVEVTVGDIYTVDFTPVSQTDRHRVEVAVDPGDDPAPAEVDVRVDGGDWIALNKVEEGLWGKDMKVKPHSEVEFRATSPDGETVTSRTYTWN